MSCFPDKKTLFLEFHDKIDGKEEIIKCNCLENCVDSIFNVENYQVLKDSKELIGSIGGLVMMRKFPLIRYHRDTVFTLRDFCGKADEG